MPGILQPEHFRNRPEFGCGQELYLLVKREGRQNPFDGTDGYPSREKAAQTALGASGFAPVKRLPRSFAGRNRVRAFALTCAEFFTGAENPAAHFVLLCTTVTQCLRFAPSQLIPKHCSPFLLKSFIRTTLRKCRNQAKECTGRTFFGRQYS